MDYEDFSNYIDTIRDDIREDERASEDRSTSNE